MRNQTEAQKPMGEIVIGVGGFQASKSNSGTLKTYALGSCVALLLYDGKRKIGGMVHVALPDSATNKKRAEDLPGYFADTGVNALMAAMNALRGDTDGQTYGTDRKELVVKLAGGAKVLKSKNFFNIGERNVNAVTEYLKSYGLQPLAQDTGGSFSRTVSLDLNTGEVRIQCPGRGEWSL